LFLEAEKMVKYIKVLNPGDSINEQLIATFNQTIKEVGYGLLL
jgi:hypothetical protein